MSILKIIKHIYAYGIRTRKMHVLIYAREIVVTLVTAEKTMVRERDVERALVREVRRAGGEAYKWVSPGNDGVPDRIIVMDGRVVFVELKSDTGRLRPVQKMQIEKLRALGQQVEVVRGMEGIREFFRKMKGGDAN